MWFSHDVKWTRLSLLLFFVALITGQSLQLFLFLVRLLLSLSWTDHGCKGWGCEELVVWGRRHKGGRRSCENRWERRRGLPASLPALGFGVSLALDFRQVHGPCIGSGEPGQPADSPTRAASIQGHCTALLRHLTKSLSIPLTSHFSVQSTDRQPSLHVLSVQAMRTFVELDRHRAYPFRVVAESRSH